MKLFEIVSKFLDSAFVLGLRRIAMRLYSFWPIIVASLLVWFVLGVWKSFNDLKNTRLNAKEVKLWNKEIELNAEEDSILVAEIRKLKDNEVIIIQSHYNERVEIKRIPDDSLQLYADSLYGSR